MSRTSPVKFRVFRREFLRNHSMNWTQIFRENLNCYALSIFRVFILLASSDSDKHMLMGQKVSTKIRQFKCFFKTMNVTDEPPQCCNLKWFPFFADFCFRRTLRAMDPKKAAILKNCNPSKASYCFLNETEIAL